MYPIAYGAKFALKKSGVDFKVMPLEALWWTSPSGAFKAEDREKWRWTAMIMVPDAVTSGVVDQVRAEAMRKRPTPTLAKVRLQSFREGTSAQLMHIGPYSAEMPNIEKLHAFIAEQGYRLAGKHHEIDLGDPRRAAPETLPIARRSP